MNAPASKTLDHPTGGFSLIEIIIAVALVALISGMFILNLPGLTEGLGSRPLDEILQKSVRDARYHAALHKERVSLAFDEERGAFIVFSESGEELAERKSGYAEDDRVSVTFEQFLPYAGLNSGGRQDRVEISLVRFHPDRSSTPFVAILKIGNERSEHRFDPFSDLEIKREER